MVDPALPPPPIIPRQDGTVNVGLVNQEAESNYNDADILALYHVLMEIKQKHDMCKSKRCPIGYACQPSNEWILPSVLNWPDTAETSTREWVQYAIKARKAPTIFPSLANRGTHIVYLILVIWFFSTSNHS
ncbi:hypothetical protein O181_100211 [Austropuccinia psidii MF-1]|uniref:Uncharacterized protein n=1 Tax=Austropuccinia psidii MF-1 TaxID=1389203 RepID=A0A9Q3PHK8_9BASI|nr:hypothetical protein [Austropuccinia psidii MF-1]